MFRKLYALFLYEKARNAASHEDYTRTLDILSKTPSRFRKSFYYLLRAYALERLGKFQESLYSYDNATVLIANLKNVTEDEKEYLLKYIDYGYANIYKLLGKKRESKDFIGRAENRTYSTENVRNYIKKDFQMNEENEVEV